MGLSVIQLRLEDNPMRKLTLIALFITALAGGLFPVVGYAQPVCAYPAQGAWRGYWRCEYPAPEYYPPPDYYTYYDYPYYDIPYYWGPYLCCGGSVGRVYPRGGGYHGGGGNVGGGVRGGGWRGGDSPR